MIDLRTIFVLLHIIGTVVGAGAATVTDYLFFKFARDGRVDKDELQIVRMVSELVWIGLLILLGSAFGFVLLYIADHNSIRGFYNLDKIMAKATIVAILIANGFVLHRVVLPIFAAQKGKSFATKHFMKKSPIIFTAGAVSSVSWYTTLILGGWRSLQASYADIMMVYLAALVLAVLVSNLAGRSVLHRWR